MKIARVRDKKNLPSSLAIQVEAAFALASFLLPPTPSKYWSFTCTDVCRKKGVTYAVTYAVTYVWAQVYMLPPLLGRGL